MITASIVLYKNDPKILLKSIRCFLDSKVGDSSHLYLIDNSPTDELKDIIINPKVEYIFNPSNPGFGASHNIALVRAINENIDYHFIINPDVVFSEDVIVRMTDYMAVNLDIGMMMPQILNDDGTVQNLPKLLPSPMSVLMRKLKRPESYYAHFIDNYELRFVSKNQIYNAPVLSGCFTTLRLDAVREVGMYDDRFFMYFEDWDLSRRMHQKYKTVYFPDVSITHGYESGANKSKKLFKIFIQSAIHYFNKWGWFFDKDRNRINKKTLEQFR